MSESFVWYRFEEGTLWRQLRQRRAGSFYSQLLSQRPIPLTLDYEAPRSYDEMVFSALLRDFFAGDQQAERMALIMASHILPFFPNKRAAGRWTITENCIALAVTEALARHKIAVDTASAEIEILSAERRDNKRLSAGTGQ